MDLGVVVGVATLKSANRHPWTCGYFVLVLLHGVFYVLLFGLDKLFAGNLCT